eukprot:6214777-Pleurochrysis_carterae.AAC.4
MAKRGSVDRLPPLSRLIHILHRDAAPLGLRYTRFTEAPFRVKTWKTRHQPLACLMLKASGTRIMSRSLKAIISAIPSIPTFRIPSVRRPHVVATKATSPPPPVLRSSWCQSIVVGPILFQTNRFDKRDRPLSTSYFALG